MLSIPPSTRVFLARGPTDVRKSFDGLSALAQSILRQDPFPGHLFVFWNRRRDRLKVLYWDSSGFCILHKRLERGTFSWPGKRPRHRWKSHRGNSPSSSQAWICV
jgi:transposase